MSHFIVEHKYRGEYIMETIMGVEDIDMSMYKNLLGLWVCDSVDEVKIVEEQLKEMRHARPSK
jgi:hypothetical protein